jgi:hypothetical protein
MTCSLTEEGGFVHRQMNKLLAIISGMAVFALLTLVPLWRGCIYSPNAKFSAVIYALPALGFYFAAIVVITRLKKMPGST